MCCKPCKYKDREDNALAPVTSQIILAAEGTSMSSALVNVALNMVSGTSADFFFLISGFAALEVNQCWKTACFAPVLTAASLTPQDDP